MRHVILVCVCVCVCVCGWVWHNFLCNTTRSFEWRDSFVCLARLSFICVIQLIHTCVWHRDDTPHGVLQCVAVCCSASHVTHTNEWRDSFVCLARLLHMCDTTHSYVCLTPRRHATSCVFVRVCVCVCVCWSHDYIWTTSLGESIPQCTTFSARTHSPVEGVIFVHTTTTCDMTP